MVSEADPAAIRALPRVFQTRLACGMDAHTCIAAAAPLHVAQMRTLKIALQYTGLRALSLSLVVIAAHVGAAAVVRKADDLCTVASSTELRSTLIDGLRPLGLEVGEEEAIRHEAEGAQFRIGPLDIRERASSGRVVPPLPQGGLDAAACDDRTRALADIQRLRARGASSDRVRRHVTRSDESRMLSEAGHFRPIQVIKGRLSRVWRALHR